MAGSGGPDRRRSGEEDKGRDAGWDSRPRGSTRLVCDHGFPNGSGSDLRRLRRKSS